MMIAEESRMAKKVVSKPKKVPPAPPQVTKPYEFTISDMDPTETNWRNRSRVLCFTVNLWVGTEKLMELSDVRLIDGRIQIPERRKQTPQGELRRKVVRPLHVLLRGIYDALLNSDILAEYPDVPTPLPPVNREFQADLQQQEDDETPPRYRR